MAALLPCSETWNQKINGEGWATLHLEGYKMDQNCQSCLLVTTLGGIHSQSVAVIIFLCVLGVFFSTLHESEEQGCHSNSSWTRRTANTCISGGVAFTLISLNLSLSFKQINTFAHLYDMHLSHQRSLCTLHPIFSF